MNLTQLSIKGEIMSRNELMRIEKNIRRELVWAKAYINDGDNNNAMTTLNIIQEYANKLTELAECFPKES